MHLGSACRIFAADANRDSADANRVSADANLFSADANPTIADVGAKFLLQMRRSKRRGAFEQAYKGFEAAARVLWMSQDPSMCEFSVI